jgi:hypothetical protein
MSVALPAQLRCKTTIQEGEERRGMSALNNPVVAVIVSLIITVAYFAMVDHYLMDMQGLDFWYLFRQ